MMLDVVNIGDHKQSSRFSFASIFIPPIFLSPYIFPRSSPVQLRLHLIIELFQDAYDCSSPCPSQVTSFLFKVGPPHTHISMSIVISVQMSELLYFFCLSYQMMSVHRERMVSENILKTLCDIALTAAYQIG